MKNTDYKNEVTKKRNVLAYLLIAFHQGVSYISQLAIQFFFKDELKIEITKLAQINSIIHIPWAIKPLLGLMTDLLPIYGYRRKVYIILCGIINLICWIYMAFYTQSANMTCFIIFLINLTLSFCSVLGEAVVVELSKLETEDKESKAKDLVSMFFFSRTVGELISSYLKGLFVDIMSLRKIFLIASFIPTILISAGFILVEKPIHEETISNDENENLMEEEGRNYGSIEISNSQKNDKSLMKEFFNFISQKYVFLPLLFIVIFKASPSYYDPFFYFITNELKINATSLGKISFCSTITILIAIAIYKSYMKNFNFKSMIVIGTIISFFISLLCYLLVLRVNLKFGIPDFWLLLFTNSFLSMVGEFILLPILSLACVVCPKNLEGTIYSVFMSSLNLGGILSNLNGGLLAGTLNISTHNYDNLHLLILIAKVSSLIPLPMLYFINDKYFRPKEDIELSKVSKKESVKSYDSQYSTGDVSDKNKLLSKENKL
jgi:folate/biopterin transporter